MSLKEVDFRDALAPLAGDPVQDAADVLDSLPNPGVPPIGWWLLGLGLAAGIVVGVFWGPEEQEKPAPDPQPVKKIAPDAPPAPKTYEESMAELRRRFPEHFQEHISFFGLGEVEITEPDAEPASYKGSYKIAMGSVLRSGPAAQAGLLLAQEVQVRLDHDSSVLISQARKLELRSGRIFVHTGYEGEATVWVRALGLPIALERGLFQVQIRGDRVEVLCIDGVAQVTPEDRDRIEVSSGTALSVDPVGEARTSRKIAFMPSETGWMSKLLILQQDQSELQERVRTLIEAYFGSDHRDAALDELRRLTSYTLQPMVDALESHSQGKDQRFLVETADFIGKNADYNNVGPVFRLLRHPNGEVRVKAYEHISRITDTNPTPGDEFWRGKSTPAQREKMIQEWWQLVK